MSPSRTEVEFPPGTRTTRQRAAVAAAVEDSGPRFTVLELHELALRSCPGLGLATTYRALELLLKAGAVRALPAEGPGTYIRCRPGHHHHLVCVSCGDVQETELCAAPAAEELRRVHGFVPESHEIDIFGRCSRCAA